MSKDLSAKYYQDNEERLQTKLVKEIKVFLKKKKKRSNDIVVNDTKDLPEDEKQKLVGYFTIIIKYYFCLENFISFCTSVNEVASI